MYSVVDEIMYASDLNKEKVNLLICKGYVKDNKWLSYINYKWCTSCERF